MTHPSEAGHFYSRDGQPYYEIVGANGKLRPTTLRDARKLSLVPSVTTVIRTAAAPGLERWKLNEMLHAALTLPRMPEEPEAAWISRVWTDSQETAKKAAERGTAIHAAIQGAYEGEYSTDIDLLAHIGGAMKEVDKWISAEWVAERSFAHELGFGGKVDLHSDCAVLDFKSKEFDAETDLKTWDEHAQQLAAYREGLQMPKARAAICYVSVSNPGLSRLIEIPEEELERGWAMFVYLLLYWKEKTRFNSAWKEEKAAA